MPSAQVIDRNPQILPREDYSPLEKTLQSFSQRFTQNQQENRDTDALREIYRQYQQDGQNIEDAFIGIQTRPGISPTARVNAAKDLMAFQKHNQELQKNAARQIQIQEKARQTEEKSKLEMQQKEKERQRVRQALKNSGETDERADLYDISPIGAQTKIIEDYLETENRKKTPVGLQRDDIEDYDKGLTPKERVKRQDARFNLQTPLVTKNSDSLTSLENEKLSIELLGELDDSGKVGEGVHNLNINPKTGDLIIPKFATAEEQLFVKTVNDFTVKAKDSFGARVTNFELDRFMQRLPTLANSSAGRKLILRQMKIINEINSMEKRAIQGVFDQYGVRNIDYVDAENKARAQIKDQKEALRKEYLNLEQLAKKEDKALVENVKVKTLEGYTAMRKPDGTIKQFPTKNVPNLEEKGYKKL